jgi:heptosyltransferase-2
MSKSIIWQLFRLMVGRNNRKLSKDDFSSPNILVMRYGFLGDVLQTTPLLKAIRKAWPDARIDYWVSDIVAPALLNNPHISSIINADCHGKLELKKPLAVFRNAFKLRRVHYDLAVCLGSDPFYGFLAWLAGIKFRAGLIVSKEKAAFLDVWTETPLSDRISRQQRYLELLHQLDISISVEDEKIDIFWSAEDERKMDDLLGQKPTKLISLFCGTGPARFRPWANRRWRIDSWVDLAQKLVQHYPGIKILLVGTDQEAEANKKIASSLPESRVIDLSGKTSFPQLGSVLKRCKLLISNDSAPVFVAAAVGCPSIVIYGPEWPERARPLNGSWYPVYVEMECRDNCCSFPDKAPTCRNECMGFIAVEAVVEAIDKVTKDWD